MRRLTMLGGVPLLLVAVACARKPVITGSQSKSDLPPSSAAIGIQSTDGTRESVKSSGRRVSLFDIRSSMFAAALMPSLDQLPCPYFKQGPKFEMKGIPGGPPVPIPGPIQNFYSGNWSGDSQYNFRVSLWNRLYHDAGIPDWTLEQPDRLSTQYVPKLFDIVVTNPQTPGCAMTARRLN